MFRNSNNILLGIAVVCIACGIFMALLLPAVLLTVFLAALVILTGLCLIKW